MTNLITEVSRETVVTGVYTNTDNNETYQIQYSVQENNITKFCVTISAKDGSYIGNANFVTSSSSITVREQSTFEQHANIINELYSEIKNSISNTATV